MSQTKTKPDFVHLHNHSHYSLLDGLQKVPEMLDRAKALGMRAIALTDHGTLSGTIEFYNHCLARDLKPIIGIETYVAPRSHTDKTGKTDANPYHLILLAENLEGYRNLMQLSTTAHLDGFYYKPRVDRELLVKHHSGIIALSACASGEVARHVLNGSLDQAEATIRWYQETFGPNNYFLELQDHQHQWEEQSKINQALIKLSRDTGAPMVVTADSHYCKPEDKEAHEILLCVQTGKTIGDSDRLTMGMDLFLSDPVDIAARWQDHPELLANTQRIADRCNLKLDLGNILIPKYPVPTGDSENAYLKRLCWQGLMWRYGNIAKEDMALVTEASARAELKPEVVKRGDYELSIVSQMGFAGYFLIVADFINWGKNRGIIFGPGRGSAAGSILAYALNITDLDPLHYDLLFERFLNPDRISMPDIDIDIQDSRRDEVIAYVAEKYGQDRVAQIITFGTMAARAAMRDAGRALGMPYAEVDAIAKLVPMPIQGRHLPLAASAGLVKSSNPEHRPDPDLVREYRSNPRAKRLIDTAVKLEGTIRSNGVHAAGVVIAPDNIVGYTPLQRAQKGGITTQYEMHAVEEGIGLLKMDFLGLSNLTIINNALRIIKKVYSQPIDLADLPLDDTKAFAMLSRGETTGVFQLESAGMRRYLRELKPNQFEDIIAMVALYRPGPMAELPRYIEGKLHPTRVTYPHPSLEPILRNTYGVMVYQEQIIALLQLIAGYSPGQADLVRKAIGKKKRDIMAKEHPKFIEGCLNQGLTKDRAESLWALIQPFADYSFNKAHAACYALIAYQTAYLKANYPDAYMAALMTSDYGNIERIGIEVAECQRLGIAVLPPDVNESFAEFSVRPDQKAIRFGLSAIKNVGLGAIEALLAARQDGPFESIEDFAQRVSSAEANRKFWESLIKAGAMDSLGDRAQLLFNLDLIMAYANKAQKNALSGQIDIFGSMGIADSLPGLNLEPPAEALADRDRLSWEKELLGLYLSEHPLVGFAAYLEAKTTPLTAVTAELEGKNLTVGGIITAVRKITTKNGAAMAFVKLEDLSGGALELIVFPKAYEQSAELWQADLVISAQGRVSAKDRNGQTGEPKVMVDLATQIDPEVAAAILPTTPEPLEGDLWLTVDLEDGARLVRLKQLLSQHQGTQLVYLKIAQSPAKSIRLPLKVRPSTQLVEALAGIIGPDSVVLKSA